VLKAIAIRSIRCDSLSLHTALRCPRYLPAPYLGSQAKAFVEVEWNMFVHGRPLIEDPLTNA
jgi:hypothetical protein